MLGLYRTIGERLKHQFLDNDAWVLSYREECFDQIGLKPSIKIPLYNGSLECEFRKYEIFDGKYKEFKSQEGEGEEKKETEGNYDTSRPRERKEFKPRGEGEFKPRREANSNLVAKGNSSHAEKESTSHVGKGNSNLVKKETSSRDGKKEALPGMTGTESLEASSVGKEIRELRENSEETVSLGYRRRKKSNFIDS